MELTVIDFFLSLKGSEPGFSLADGVYGLPLDWLMFLCAVLLMLSLLLLLDLLEDFRLAWLF